MDIKIIDNFMPVEVFKEFQLLVRDIPWYTTLVLPKENLECDPIYNFMFAHSFYKNNAPSSELYSQFIEPLFSYIPIKSLIRAKINLNPRAEKIIQHGYHVDNEFNNSFTSILYFNTNNGYTEFENGKIFNAVENNAIIFDGKERHRSVSQTDNSAKINININYEVYK